MVLLVHPHERQRPYRANQASPPQAVRAWAAGEDPHGIGRYRKNCRSAKQHLILYCPGSARRRCSASSHSMVSTGPTAQLPLRFARQVSSPFRGVFLEDSKRLTSITAWSGQLYGSVAYSRPYSRWPPKGLRQVARSHGQDGPGATLIPDATAEPSGDATPPRLKGPLHPPHFGSLGGVHAPEGGNAATARQIRFLSTPASGNLTPTALTPAGMRGRHSRTSIHNGFEGRTLPLCLPPCLYGHRRIALVRSQTGYLRFHALTVP